MRSTVIFFLWFFVIFQHKTDAGKPRPKRKLFIPHGKPTNCFGLLCDDTKDYPEDHILKTLNKNKKMFNEHIFGAVIEPAENMVLPVPKSGFEKEERSFCETTKVTIYPRVAYDIDLKPRFVVNLAGHQQSVSFEICLSDTCFENNFLLGYKTSCRQLYNNVKLLFLTETGQLEYGQFSVPSTCVCKYTIGA